MRSIAAVTLLSTALVAGLASMRDPGLTLTIIEQPDAPVIARGHPGTEDNKYGSESGCALKVAGDYQASLWAPMRGLRTGRWDWLRRRRQPGRGGA